VIRIPQIRQRWQIAGFSLSATASLRLHLLDV
jgi:hypothetical protein